MMSIGASDPYYPVQPNPACPLELDDTYFLVKLRGAQVFFPAGPLTQVDSLLISSSVESSFMSGTSVQSLHKLTSIKKNVPCHLSINTNLTDWLPARSTDLVKITLKCTITRGAPVHALIDKMEQLDLSAKVSAIRPDAAVAIKITQIVGNLLSTLLQEGGQTEVLSLVMDLNVADLKSGYYTVIGSLTDEIWPNTLQVDVNGQLISRGGGELSRLSYAVIQVLTLKRRGSEALREQTWGELRQLGIDQALSAPAHTEEERNRALESWRAVLAQIRILARKDRAFLQKEVDGIIAEAQLEVERKLLPRTTQEAGGLEAYPPEWQEVLGVTDQQELRRAVRDYQDALELSERLMQQYK